MLIVQARSHQELELLQRFIFFLFCENRKVCKPVSATEKIETFYLTILTFFHRIVRYKLAIAS